MSYMRRLQKEIMEIRESNEEYIKDINEVDGDSLTWTCSLKPSDPPYQNSELQILIKFPTEYPFKPPTIHFISPMYHPNIDLKGVPCLPMLFLENWKPNMKIKIVLEALVALINTPQADHPIREDIAELYMRNRNKYISNAEEFCRKIESSISSPSE